MEFCSVCQFESRITVWTAACFLKNTDVVQGHSWPYHVVSGRRCWGSKQGDEGLCHTICTVSSKLHCCLMGCCTSFQFQRKIDLSVYLRALKMERQNVPSGPLLPAIRCLQPTWSMAPVNEEKNPKSGHRHALRPHASNLPATDTSYLSELVRLQSLFKDILGRVH